MKCVMHKQDTNYRVQSRGKFYYVQHNDESQGNKTHDPWQDVGKPRDRLTDAMFAMYSIKPMVKA